eukprot:1036495-Pleurochrysis_carterae.AAC.1
MEKEEKEESEEDVDPEAFEEGLREAGLLGSTRGRQLSERLDVRAARKEVHANSRRRGATQ